MPGSKRSLADLARSEPLPARVPAFATKDVPVDKVSANPRNRRRLDPSATKFRELVSSIATMGQLEPCAVVTRNAYVGIFPEDDASIPHDQWYVQVTGARRRAAVLELGVANLDITVKDDLATDRATFLAATATENIERAGLNPIEEAEAIEDLVAELGEGKLAAAKLSKDPAWVSRRRNLLKLAAEVQDLLRSGEVSARLVRDLHKVPEAEQMTELARLRAMDPDPPADDEVGEKPRLPTGNRLSPVARAINRLGGTPEGLAKTLRDAV